MKLQSLATLSAVISEGSFAAAAERVHLTRSAVSLQMKQLESYFGEPLFDRSGRNVRPTTFALEVARTVDGSMAAIEALRNKAESAPRGHVRLGITGSAQTTLLPIAFADLQQHSPGIQLSIARGNTPELLASLKAGRIDAAVLIRPQSGGSSRLLWTDLLRDAMVLVVPQDLPSSSPQRILREHPWIRFDRSLVAGRMAAQFVDRIVPQKPALIDLDGLDAIVAMVGAGIGVSVLPRLREEHLLAHAVREVSLGPKAPIRVMALVKRQSDADNRLVGAVQSSFERAALQLKENTRD